MLTLVIFDKYGKPVFSMKDATETDFKAEVVEIPEGKYISGFDYEKNEAIFSDIPANELEVLRSELEYQKEVSQELEVALYDIAEMLASMTEGQ